MATSVLNSFSSTTHWLQKQVPLLVELVVSKVANLLKQHNTALYFSAAVGTGLLSYRMSLSNGIIVSFSGTTFVVISARLFQKLNDQFYTWKYGMPSNFWKNLKASNQQKRADDAPVALILKARADHNGILSKPDSQRHILEIAKTYYVAFKVLDSSKGISQKIQEARQELEGRSIQLLSIVAHGAPGAIQFGQKVPDECYLIDDVQPADFEQLSPDATILLDSCYTGQGLAQKISDVSHRSVIAPLESLRPFFSFFFYCPQHHRIEMHSFYQAQHCRVFEWGKPPSFPCPLDRDIVFKRIHEFEERATRADALADDLADGLIPKMALGYLYLNYPEIPSKRYQKLANHLSADQLLLSAAFYELGCLDQEGKKDPPLPPNMAKVIEKFEIAGLLFLNDKALMALAQLYHEGKKIPRDDLTAYKWYRFLANHHPTSPLAPSATLRADVLYQSLPLEERKQIPSYEPAAILASK